MPPGQEGPSGSPGGLLLDRPSDPQFWAGTVGAPDSQRSLYDGCSEAGIVRRRSHR